MALPDCTAPRPETQSKEEHHRNLLESYHRAWIAIEHAQYPPMVIRCFISSIKLAILTLDTIEEELKVLLEMAQQKLREIEDADHAAEQFDEVFHTRK